MVKAQVLMGSAHQYLNWNEWSARRMKSVAARLPGFGDVAAELGTFLELSGKWTAAGLASLTLETLTTTSDGSSPPTTIDIGESKAAEFLVIRDAMLGDDGVSEGGRQTEETTTKARQALEKMPNAASETEVNPVWDELKAWLQQAAGAHQ